VALERHARDDASRGPDVDGAEDTRQDSSLEPRARRDQLSWTEWPASRSSRIAATRAARNAR
jgi:hypothetical protein